MRIAKKILMDNLIGVNKDTLKHHDMIPSILKAMEQYADNRVYNFFVWINENSDLGIPEKTLDTIFDNYKNSNIDEMKNFEEFFDETLNEVKNFEEFYKK